MRLSAIKLAGFKSFVDPTTLSLASNLSGVVGPNGCGKSNVIDAVRWVTGESSARQLRGEALEDVIFNGSRARKPVGRASVELKFDNNDGTLGGQYGAFAEISVRRELARDGASRYFINNAKARRRDVIDLFLGTGLGGRSNYALIEQGAVNRLIEAKPEQMRQVLEEAAGISKYKERRRETENRIRHTRENLDRLDDLIGEVNQRLSVLKRQAADAEKYKALKADERRLRAELLALRWSEHNAHLEAAQARLSAREDALRAAVCAQNEAERTRETAAGTQQTAVDALQRCQADFYDAQSRAGRIEQQLAHAREMQRMRERERAELVARLESLDTRDGHDARAQREIDDEQQRTDAERVAANWTLEAAQTALDAAERAAADAEAAWEHHSGADENPVQQLDAERTRERYASERVEQLVERLDARTAERDALGTNNDDALAAADRDIAQRAERLGENEKAAADAGAQVERLRASLGEAESAVDRLRTELGENQAKLASERALQQSVLRENDPALGEWLHERGYDAGAGVARRVRVAPEWQRAAEAALGPWLRGFLVDALPDAGGEWPDQPLTLIEDDADAGGERASSAPEGAACLVDVIEGPAVVRARAARVFVVDDVDTALSLRGQLAGDQCLVTRDGCCIGAASLTTPASGEAAERGVLARERRIAALDDDVAARQQGFERRGEAIEADRRRLAEAREHRQTLDTRIGEARRALEAARAEQQGARIRAEQRDRRRQEIDAELAELVSQIEAAQTEHAELGAAVERLAESARAFSDARRAAQQSLAAARAARDRARGEQRDAEQALRAIEARHTERAHRAEALAGRRRDTADTRADVVRRLEVFDADGPDAAAATPDEDQQAQAKAAQAEAERALRAARERLSEREAALKQAGEALMQAQQASQNARDSAQQIRIEVETAGVRRDGVAEQIAEIAETPAALAAQLPDDADAERWHAEIAAIERKIQRLGAINLAAIEEHDAEAERESYLADQHADLRQALETLEAAIGKIDRETRQRFKATYEQVNARFATMFPELFGGGEAGLELTEDDWLSTGVRVMARPPGKRNASIQMLSGGEKALTAVALLFALFELNPAPFCMLDEIDAPLDDANVSRFCDLVRRMSAQVQFIVITHNKLTMELTEQLHGVTMAEPGVSRLVSVDIDQALDMAG